MGKHSTSGMGGFMSGASIRFSKLKSGSGGADAWRDALMQKSFGQRASNRARTTGIKLPKLHSIHQAHVASIQEYGAFVQLGKGDTYKDGLLHVSGMAEDRVESCEEAGVKLDMKLWVKVSDVRDDEGKYSLDMRYVDQRDGSDLDTLQTKGRCPDNHFEGRPKTATSSSKPPAKDKGFGGHFTAERDARAEAEERDAKEREASQREETRGRDDDRKRSHSRSGGKEKKHRKKDKKEKKEETPEDREKARLKLEKANKKRDKAQKKLEKMRKKLEEMKTGKEKKSKKKKDSSSSDSEDSADS